MEKKENKKTSLRKRMIFYFVLIAFANVFVAGEIVFELTSPEYRSNVYEAVNQVDHSARIEAIDHFLNLVVKKYLVMVSVLILLSAVILFLFVVQIASPLHYMIRIADKMSDGDLSLRINIRSKDELADLGNLINDLATNVQEIIAQVERLSFDMHKLQQMHTKNVQKHEKITRLFHKESEFLDTLTQNMLLLKNSYVLYTIDSFKRNYMSKENIIEND